MTKYLYTELIIIVIHSFHTKEKLRVIEGTNVCSYLGVELRQLLFIEVSLCVDTSFIAELKHKNKHKILANVVFISILLLCEMSSAQNHHSTHNGNKSFCVILDILQLPYVEHMSFLSLNN